MGIGKASDFKIYDDQIHAGLVETQEQNSAAFNAASAGCIVLKPNIKRGNYEYGSFFKDTSGLVSRRDTTSVSAAADIAIQQGEMVNVKLNRKIGPVAQTLDAFRKIGAQADVNSLSFLIGTQIAKGIQVEQVNTVLRALRAALVNQAAALYTIPSSGTITTVGLTQGLQKFGDAADRVKLWVMHSYTYFALLREQMASYQMDAVAGFNIAKATPVTLGRPVLIVDSAPLIVTSGSPAVNDYHVLGLTEGSALIEDSEDMLVHAELVTGLENLVVRMQGEYAYNIGLKGFTWDVSNGGANPSDTALGTGSNWDLPVADIKSAAGIVVKSR